MDIHLLAINVGNTRIAFGTFVEGELQTVSRISVRNHADLPGAIESAWAPIAGKEGAAVTAASVNPPLDALLTAAVRQATGQVVQWIGKDIDAPIQNLTEKPSQTGIDRLLNMAAAYEQMQKACVVVDAGTAITLSVCDDAGHFLGGAIAPGAGTMLSALHAQTASLPEVTLAVPAEAIGKTTEDAIRNGVFHGLRGMVKELVENYATQLGRWPDIIATGGDARLLFGDWEFVHAVSPDLTLYGIALAYTEHHIKHDH